jgi:hypothetical protein
MKPRGIQHHLFEGLRIVLVCMVVYTAAIYGQDPRVQELTAPPPLKIVSREERTQLDESKDAKTRVRKTIELADGHLLKAEEQTTQNQHDAASAELGKYWALVEDVLRFLSPLSHDNNKTRDLYKRVELALRGHGPRLTSMRRTTPLEYAVWIKDVEDFARKGRTEALNSFYGQTVVRDVQKKPTNERPSDKQTKDGSSPPGSKKQ